MGVVMLLMIDDDLRQSQEINLPTIYQITYSDANGLLEFEGNCCLLSIESGA